MVTSLGSRKWTVLKRDARQVVDQGVGRNLNACHWVLKESTKRKLSPDRSTLGIWSRDDDSLVPGSLEVIDGEHALTFLRIRSFALTPAACSKNHSGACHVLCPSLAQIGAGDFADHPNSRLYQVVLDK
jgi:hypothetical protein